MSTEHKSKSVWNALFGRPDMAPAPSVVPVPSAKEAARIQMPEEQRKRLEEAIPFHRPAEQTVSPDGAQFLSGPLENSSEPREAKANARPPEVESYRKKYKKYGRDVCLPGGDDAYDVLSDKFDTSHHRVDGLSPL